MLLTKTNNNNDETRRGLMDSPTLPTSLQHPFFAASRCPNKMIDHFYFN
jgi:hypothetical protein